MICFFRNKKNREDHQSGVKNVRFDGVAFMPAVPCHSVIVQSPRFIPRDNKIIEEERKVLKK